MSPRGSQRYRTIENVTSVTDRSAGEIVLLLFQRIDEKLRVAERACEDGRGADSSEPLAQAIDLITHGLLNALDYQRGGEIAAKLGQLYDYAIRRLLLARLRRDPATIREVAELLSQLRGAWAAIATKERASTGTGASAAPVVMTPRAAA